MQKFIAKQRGAISIFLVIILLPMMTLGCVMVDLSRIQLARSVASAAGDLSLNTGLTCYDNVLKDMYGLFAVSQDYDTLMGNLEEYYKNSIAAAGLSDKDADNYVKQIMNYLGGVGATGDVTDLLQIEVTNFENPVNEGASLINTALTKSQIINFMKYRGPIDMGLGFLDSLKSFTTVGDQMAVIENRKKYYDEQKTVIESCQKAWENFYGYSKLAIKEKDFKRMAENFEKYKGEYEFINKNIIRDYYNSKDYFNEDTHTHAFVSGTDYTFKYKGKKVDVGNVSAGSYDALESYAKKADGAMTNFNNGKINEDIKKLHIDKTTGIYEIQRVIKYRRSIGKSGSYGDMAKEVYVTYNEFQSAKKSIEDKIKELESEISKLEDNKSKISSSSLPPAQKAAAIESINSSISSLEEEKTEKEGWLNNIKSWDSKLNSSYKTIMEEFSNITNKIMLKKTIDGQSKIECNGSSGTYDNDEKLVPGKISEEKIKGINEEISKFYDDIVSGIDFLKNAKSCLDYVKTSVSEGGKLVEQENNWKNSAGKDSINGMSIAEQNLAEVDSVHEFINKEDVGELMAHIDGAIISLNKAKSEIEQYKYGDKMIKDIKSIDEAIASIKALGLTEGLEDVSIIDTELSKKVETVLESAYKESETGLTKEWTDPKKDHPEIDHKEAKHKFYAFLKNNFEAVTKEDGSYNDKKGKSQGELDKITGSLDKYEEEEKPSKDETTGKKDFQISGDNLPSKLWPGIKANIVAKNNSQAESESSLGGNPLEAKLNPEGEMSGTLTNMFSQLGSALMNMGIVLRDDLFIDSYAMSMFSYDTIEKEAIWEANGSNPKLSEVKKTIGKGQSIVYDKDGKIILNKKAGEVQKELLTMTNVPISPLNNVAYRSEVEYMTFGDNGVGKTYGIIYGIRVAFNTIYAFSDSSIREGARGIAMAVFGTPPLTFLVPIAQAAIIIGVALAESALDLMCLSSGMAVPIYKTKKTWMLSFENLFNAAKDVLVETVLTAGEQLLGETIDRGVTELNDWLNKSSDELKEVTESEINELKKAVDSAISSTAEQYAGTAVDQLIALCRTAKTLKSAGQLVDKNKNEIKEIEYVKQALNDWVNDGKDIKDSVIYIAKKEAVKIILENNYVAQMLDKIESVAANTESALDEYNRFIKGIVLKINTKINDAGGEIKNYIDKANSGLQEKIGQGADKLKESIGGIIDGLGSKMSSGTKVDANVGVVSSLYSFQYSDYLRLFLLIGLIADQEGVLMKMENVIQINMVNQKEGFELRKSYTYIEVNANLEVKPLFMKLPFMPEDTGNLVNNNKNWYSIKYKGIQGY